MRRGVLTRGECGKTRPAFSRNARRPRLRGLLSATLVVGALVGLAGCGQSAREVYSEAATAAGAKDFDAFCGWLTERSATLVRGVQAASDESRGRSQYLKDPFALLPSGDVQAEEQKGNLTILKVGRSERDAEEVLLLLEPDGWRIDVLDSPRFWDPLMVKTNAKR